MPETLTLDGPLLCLDVSSTCCGWAAFHPDGRPSDFGTLRPRGRAPSAVRIDWIAEKVVDLHNRLLPAAALMEWSTGKVHRRIRGRSGGAGLAVLGQAQGAVRSDLSRRGCPVCAVGENDWTRGEPKDRRAWRVALLVPRYGDFYRAGDDPGYDAADAIGLGLWYFDKAREMGLIARAEGRST